MKYVVFVHGSSGCFVGPGATSTPKLAEALEFDDKDVALAHAKHLSAAKLMNGVLEVTAFES